MKATPGDVCHTHPPDFLIYFRHTYIRYIKRGQMVEYRQSPNGLKASAVYRKPLNVGLVAKICRVSKKTVLNWIYRDALKAFKTDRKSVV